MPIHSPAIAAGERWDDVGVVGRAEGAAGVAGENAVVGWVGTGFEVECGEDGVGVEEVSTARVGCGAVDLCVRCS